MTRLSTDWATLPRLSAPRQIGETSSRSMVPRLMSSMKPIPTQAEDMASMTTTPDADRAAHAFWVADDVEADHARLAAVRARERGQDLDRGRLARSVRAEQAE